MTVHITNIYNAWTAGIAPVAQHMVAKIGCQELGMNEFGLFLYEWNDEPSDVLNARFDGIIASLNAGDTVIIQSPSWHRHDWDQAFIDHLNIYPDIKKIIFIHDVLPFMFENYRPRLPKYIDYYNKADLLIVPSVKMYHFLRQNGLKEMPYVVQHFWDHLVNNLDYSITPQNNKVINFAGNANKFKFIRKWNNPRIKLQVFSDPKQSCPEQNLEIIGWKSDVVLLDTLRRTGGFGLLWDEDTYWAEYIKINASFKTSTYLASGMKCKKKVRQN
ncbi:beta-1,6-galactofuranosyltransferase [Limosilactobacillus agrestis]|uniref:beta-1,6-galactofuranosyltransferase n=1 Tax=Limosilactobacillus agrestis TaxID=2759748 RepID=UPI001E401E18|nr:beta-1,6-galactofuranosyltransferase [Limosilactobacillus agrestis]MCD7112812.1 beta-1,6-galactofuranosyltransferase [Limosilactobacillus agrestis]